MLIKVTKFFSEDMKNFVVLMAVSLMVSCVARQGVETENLSREVNPLIGTDFTGNTYPGAQAPHGMVQLSPDNGLPGWDRIAGYFYPDLTIAGFSHTHLSGTGAGDLYDISFMPVVEPLSIAEAPLLNGEVEVKGNHGEGLICLSPGQMAHLDAKSRKLVVKQVEDMQEHWYSTTLSFNKSGLRSIAATLERIYGVKVILSPQLDLQKTYTGTVPKKETVEEVLELMQNAMPIKYKVVGNSVFITK